MTTYTVYLPPEDSMKNMEEEFHLIPDAKATLALIFPPFWLAWHKLWLPLMAYFVVIAAIIILAFLNPSIAVSYLSILPGLYLLLEGYQLVRNTLEDKGWRYAGIVEGENMEEAEIRFLMGQKEEITKATHFFQTQNKSNPTNPKPHTTPMSLFPE